MFQPGSIPDPAEGPPPPVPPRNPLRNDHYRVQKLSLLSYKETDSAVTSLGRPTLDRIAESSRENVDAYPVFASPRHANRDFILDGSEVNPRSLPDRTPHRLSFMSLSDDEDDASLVSRRSSWTIGLKRFSSLRERRTPSTVQSSAVSSKMQSGIEQAMVNLQGKLDDADADLESLTTISSYDGGSRLEIIQKDEEENSRIEAWLQRGTIDAPSIVSKSSLQTDPTPRSPSQKKSPALSVFPPTSPTTGRREYVYPSSPMNNGRDAYGNYIPTNTQDYMTARNIPSSQKSRSDVEDTQIYGHNSTSTARLRGGGGWWNALGIGSKATDSPQRMQPEVAASEASRKQAPAQSLRAKRQPGNLSQYSASVLSDGGGSYVGRSLVGDTRNPVSLEQTRPAQPDEHVTFASILGQRSDNQTSTTHVTSQRPSSRTYTNNDTVPDLPRQPHGSYDYKISHAGSAHKPVPTAFSKTSKKVESPWPGVSYNPRSIKKWNQEPASGPPSSLAMPPPPLLERAYTDTEVASSVGVLNPSKYRYERSPSPAESYDDQAWDLQSLQLGESVSVAGGTRRTYGGAARSRNVPFDPEEFEAALKRAQIEFRPLCQDVMMRHNAVMAGYERELKEGTIEKDQYERNVRFQMQNMEKSLEYSAKKSKYVILTSEFSILESLSSPDSYAIYQALLSTTNPELWRSLVQQHNNLLTQNMKPPPPSSTVSAASRTSSLDTAKHVVGKLARFVLAVPDDPELKTVSMRKGKDIGMGMLPIAWMDPMAVSGLTGLADQDGRSISDGANADQEREKAKHVGPMISPRTETHDFATKAGGGAGHSRITGTTAVNTSTDAKRSASTARSTTSSEQSRLIQAKIQETHRPITAFPGQRTPPSKRPGATKEQSKHDQATIQPAPSDAGGTDASQQSMWPQGDANNNWWVPKGSTSLRLRGGKGKEKKAKKEKKKKEGEGEGDVKVKEKKVWLEALRAEAMYVHGI